MSNTNHAVIIQLNSFRNIKSVVIQNYNTMISYLNVVILFFLCAIRSCTCDICLTCLCSATEEGPIINCHEKELGNNDMLNVDLLMLDEHQTLNELILSRNDVVHLPGHLLKKLKHLKSLDLSDNRIEEIHTGIFTDLSNLKNLNLSRNQLKVFDDTLLKTIPSLNVLDLSYNHIDKLEHTIGESVGLISLDLSRNNISDLSFDFFNTLTSLTHLDLSFNKIRFLKEESLTHVRNLTSLHINNNLLATLRLETLPKSLVELYAGYNAITEVFYVPIDLQVLNIVYNEISQIDANLSMLSELQNLNVTGNALSDFPKVTLNKLTTLDVSHNKFADIPETLSVENFPALTKFVVSKNPIRNLKFASTLKLTSFTASNLALLEMIKADAFSRLEAPSTECINFTISANEKLSFIHENVFQHLNICSLDLSNNRINHASSKLIMPDTNFETYSIDLQGNPFNCNCSLQWMLSDLVPKLYSSQPHLLDNLRCAAPPQLSNMRMVHWYKWEGQVFCTDMSDFVENLTAEFSSEAGGRTIMFESSPGLLIAVISSITVFAILVTAGLLLARRYSMRRSRVNRRF